MARPLRKLGLLLLGTLGGLVALEVVLQVGALVLGRGAAVPVTSGDGVAVLCVGDSFTYGLGAAEPAQSYPSVLGRSPGLEDVQVVNLGWPGQDSGRVLARLPAQLETTRPAIVCVLAGYNDFWSGGEAGPSGSGFELRTVRLAKLILAALRGGPESNADGHALPASKAPFLGAWHSGSAYFEFLADGSIETHEGPLDGVYSWSGETIQIELRHADAPLEFGFRIDDSQSVRTLHLSGGPFPKPLPWSEGLPDDTLVDRARIHARAGDVVAAERDWRAALGDPALRLAATLALARHLTGGGRAEEAVGLLLALLQDTARTPTPLELQGIGDALLAAGAEAEAEAVVFRVLDAAAISDETVRFLVRTALRLPDRTRLDRALAEVIAERTMTDAQRLGLLGLRAALGQDDAAVTGVLFEVARLDPDADVLRRTLRWHRERHPRAVFEKMAASLAPAERDAVLAAYDAALLGEDATGEVLSQNLVEAVRTIRSAGAVPVLVTYPGGRADLAATIRSVAGQTGAALVDAFEAFESMLQTRSRAELFVADGHCNDAGYAALGRLVAERVREILRKG
jgi:lysophospholipase L1-like esterase